MGLLFEEAWQCRACQTLPMRTPRLSLSVLSAFVLVLTAHVPASALDVSGTTLVFDNPSGDIGSASAVGAFASYSAIGTVGSTTIDAKVTVVAVTNLDNDDDDTDGCDNLMDYIDEDPGSSPARNALSPQVDVGCGFTSGSATFRVDFLDAGAPATLTNVTVRVQDVDASQFVTVESPTTYSLSSSPATNLVVSTGTSTVTFSEPDGVDSSDTDEDNWVVMNFDSASSLTFTVGANESGSASFDFIFSATSWTNPPTTTAPTYASVAETPVSSNPAIHLDMKGRAGQQGASTPVLAEGQGLRPGSAYLLTLREPVRPLQSGSANTGGRFSHLVYLPTDLQPGMYTITLSAVGVNGESLVLSQSFRIGPDGKFVEIGNIVPLVSGGLARTGPDSTLVFGGLATTALTSLVGVALAVSSRRRARSL